LQRAEDKLAASVGKHRAEFNLFAFACFDDEMEGILSLTAGRLQDSRVLHLRGVEALPPTERADAGKNDTLCAVHPRFRAPEQAVQATAREEQANGDEGREKHPEEKDHSDAHVAAVHLGCGKPIGLGKVKNVQCAGDGAEHEDGHDAIPEEGEKQQPESCAEAAVGCTDNGATAVADEPRAFRRMVQVNVSADVAAKSQLGETVGDITVAAVGDVIGDVDLVRRNRPAAFGTDRRRHGKRFYRFALAD